ncbi:hydroxyacid dehydrogenase [Methylobacterium radiotolerans]|uniref:hydroxyacid dehydrogenase n=1 Tax=Methylobacterium radiotolerans TaxID=31998 RepID=UPI0004660787|nr:MULTISPECIES: hydroxyacid dehydrogenase [Methylobacterium]KZC02332.1 Glycerate dehydrogenase [Methylobacterium radiotolerans]MDE3749219.1 hydroxyacid dehydrogenase [Methylobacterium radiotolerans]ONF45853.1 2-hydroxyacid dehydrogenase [Methylobacterium radiotolerans]PVZ03487.1 D-3-phosphoglycerate dehydrogenase [Methylobacterium organophilum]
MITGPCLIVQPIHAAGLDRLRAAGLEPRSASGTDSETLAREVADCVAVITRNTGFPARAIAAAPALRVIGVHGTGTDHVATAEATAAGIVVVNTPGANAVSVAEQTLALIFALAKALPEADRSVRTGDDSFKFTARLIELAGLTLGLVGFGAIGQATARLAAALGLRVLAYGPSRPDADFANAGALRAASVDALLAEADIVSLHVPLTPGTRGLIGRDQLARMKREAFLINTSRGGLIDEAALVEALEAGTIAGAGLDVFAQEPLPVDHPLARQPRAILTPHVGGSTGAALIRTAETAATRVVDVLAGRRPGGLVNPDVWERRRAP